MIHAKDVLDRLGALSPIEFGDDVFRATRHGLAPLTASTRGGRWSPRDVLGATDSVATLYTSCVRDGACQFSFLMSANQTSRNIPL